MVGKRVAARPRERKRCPWLDLGKADYVAYHDEE